MANQESTAKTSKLIEDVFSTFWREEFDPGIAAVFPVAGGWRTFSVKSGVSSLILARKDEPTPDYALCCSW